MDILTLEIDSKYKKWLKTINGGDITHPSLVFMCNKHKRLNDKIPIEYRDIFKFKSVDHFVSYVDSLESESEAEEIIKNSGSALIYENEDFIVKRIYSVNAMKLYGKGSKWCIASDDSSVWDRYINEGNMFYLVISKNLPYNSQFNKFIVQIMNDRCVVVWDRSDISYTSNIFDLINLNINVFLESENSSIISKLVEGIDHDVLKILINNNAIIAGGALTSIILNEQIVDYDIWFSNKGDYDKATNEMDILYEKQRDGGIFSSDLICRYNTSNAKTFTVKSTHKFQFINPSKYSLGNIDTIINQFDFTCVMCGVDLRDRKLICNDKFFRDAKSKKITINEKLRAPASLIDRIVKYTKKGYRISKATQRVALRLLSKVTEEEINDATITLY
jgi:hypothetical protein